MRELMGPWRVVRILIMPAWAFVIGYFIFGPTSPYALTAGVLTASACVVMLAGIFLYFKLRHGRTFKLFTEAHTRFDAMSADEARAAAQHAIESSGLFRAFPATQSFGGDLPSGITDFFACYDRLDLVLPDSPSPHLSFCRTLLGPVPGNPDAVKIGELYPTGSCIAFHLPTGRVTGHDPPVRPGTVARCAVLPPARHMSVWHLVALLAEWHRLSEEHGYKHFRRRRALNDRPQWRVEPLSK